MKTCNNCHYINPDESEQKKDEIHWCKLLKRRIKHEGQHPLLPTPDECHKQEVVEEFSKQMKAMIGGREGDNLKDLLTIFFELPVGLPTEDVF